MKEENTDNQGNTENQKNTENPDNTDNTDNQENQEKTKAKEKNTEITEARTEVNTKVTPGENTEETKEASTRENTEAATREATTMTKPKVGPRNPRRRSCSRKTTSPPSDSQDEYHWANRHTPATLLSYLTIEIN